MSNQPTNYIHRLQAERDRAQREVDALREGMRQLRGYLTSAKFHQDDSVNVRDVLLRLEELGAAATDAADEN
jgi:site-specific recombinase XerD